MKTVTDITGKRFGRWTVLKQVPNVKNKVMWSCQCDCGTVKDVRGETLKFGISKSCGCYGLELAKKMGERNFQGHEEISQTYFSRIKREAIYRELDFTITIEYIWNLYLEQDRKCILTGLPIRFARMPLQDRAKTQTASLDRIDSSKGYIEGNVQWLHKSVNFMKYTLSQDEIIYYANLIARRYPLSAEAVIL